MDNTCTMIFLLDPPEVFPFTQSTYTRNESDSFTLECQAFAVPLPTLYWLPGPINATLNITGGLYNLSSSQLETFLTNIAAFNGSRFSGLTNQCPIDANESACYYSEGSVQSCDNLVTGSLCSVPCALSINTSQGVDNSNRQISISRITICDLRKEDELSYTCIAVNNITNNIGTSEGSSANLIVQGM